MVKVLGFLSRHHARRFGAVARPTSLPGTAERGESTGKCVGKGNPTPGEGGVLGVARTPTPKQGVARTPTEEESRTRCDVGRQPHLREGVEGRQGLDRPQRHRALGPPGLLLTRGAIPPRPLGRPVALPSGQVRSWDGLGIHLLLALHLNPLGARPYFGRGRRGLV